MKNNSDDRELELCRGTRLLGAEWDSGDSKMLQFLSIFHPEISIEKRISLVRENKIEKLREKECRP
jgi:hypothetical protein